MIVACAVCTKKRPYTHMDRYQTKSGLLFLACNPLITPTVAFKLCEREVTHLLLSGTIQRRIVGNNAQQLTIDDFINAQTVVNPQTH